MKIINFAEQNSIINQFMSELRDKGIQQDRLRFRRNLERIGEIMAYEISRTLNYTTREVATPLGIKAMSLPADPVVLATILRAGLGFHQGFLSYFDQAENAFISAYRQYSNETDFDIHVEYIASPSLQDKVMILADPMLATGKSMELCYKALCDSKGTPAVTHVASVIASTQAIEYIKQHLPENTVLWLAAVDDTLNAHGYIVPGLGDAGDLAYGEK
ncbi:MAG: uracil phosphoribosyltransferase [Bacteroidaceae bacterium]|nr:uracil phosphoribosyltransferase [Bacteroidales bacterium]MBP3672117.1 uracil phosphoribosyltransferase [Bacteroidaceae bacterium]MBQ2978831.1 uracil phosphoribosyltransferase [Bacteroidaceae bacterium]